MAYTLTFVLKFCYSDILSGIDSGIHSGSSGRAPWADDMEFESRRSWQAEGGEGEDELHLG